MNHSGPKGNVAKLDANAKRIVKRLLKGDATIMGLMREYHVAYKTLMRLLHAHLTEGQLCQIQKRNSARGGRVKRFKKGHVPWNKGLKGIHLSPATEFKPGCLRGAAARHWRSVGTVTIYHDKPPKRLRNRKQKAGLPPWRGKPRRWIKVRDDGLPQRRWIPLARYVWEQQHGPVPPGMFVVHVDGEPLNDDLSNLRLVDRRGHLALQIERDPGQLRRCRKNAVMATTLRHRTNRERRKIRGKAEGDVRLVAVWECQACGSEAELRSRPEQCPKCGSSCYARLERKRVS